MIASISGTVQRLSSSTAVVEVSGLGYLVQLTEAHALSLRLGQQVSLTTHLVVREDSLTLFGFVDAESQAIFELLMGVTGVGPKSALAVLGALGSDNIAHAVVNEDDAAFRKVSGVGPKTAKLIVLSLAGKVVATPQRHSTGSPSAPGILEQVTDALVGLGWPERVAADAAERAAAVTGGGSAADAQTLLRHALSLLNGAVQERGAPR